MIWFRLTLLVGIVVSVAQQKPIEVVPSTAQWCPPQEQDNPIGAIVNQKLQVQIVLPCGAGENAGLTGGDTLVSLNGQKLGKPADIQRLLKGKPKTVKLAIVRKFSTPPEKLTIDLEPNYGIR